VTQNNPCATMAPLIIIGMWSTDVCSHTTWQVNNSQMFVSPLASYIGLSALLSVRPSVRMGDLYLELWICAKIYIWNEPTNSNFD
jgi:hypothetical protein